MSFKIRLNLCFCDYDLDKQKNLLHLMVSPEAGDLVKNPNPKMPLIDAILTRISRAYSEELVDRKLSSS